MVNVSESSNWLVCGAALVNEASVDFLYCRWTCVFRGFEIVALTFIVVSERPSTLTAGGKLPHPSTH